MARIPDAHRVQELKNSITEGEGLLLGGRKSSGKRFSDGERAMIQRAIDNTRAKLEAELSGN
jgi:hypothetical protein